MDARNFPQVYTTLQDVGADDPQKVLEEAKKLDLLLPVAELMLKVRTRMPESVELLQKMMRILEMPPGISLKGLQTVGVADGDIDRAKNHVQYTTPDVKKNIIRLAGRVATGDAESVATLRSLLKQLCIPCPTALTIDTVPADAVEDVLPGETDLRAALRGGCPPDANLERTAVID